jgi:hypothetical protein
LKHKDYISAQILAIDVIFSKSLEQNQVHSVELDNNLKIGVIVRKA